MSVTITKRPEATITGNYKSHWISAVHPIVFEMQCEAQDEELRPNYRVLIKAYEVGTNTLLAKAVHRPFTNGFLEVDLHSYLEQYLLEKDDIEYKTGLVNQRDIGKSVQFYISYEEQNDNAPEGVEQVDAKRYFACIAKKQVGDPFGQNMADYVPVKASTPESGKAKFLTRFEKPVYFKGWPFSLSFIYDPNLKDIETSRVETRYDQNRTLKSRTSNLLTRQGVGFINRLYLRGNLEVDIHSIDLALHTGQVVEVGYMDEGYVAEGYVDEGSPDVNP